MRVLAAFTCLTAWRPWSTGTAWQACTTADGQFAGAVAYRRPTILLSGGSGVCKRDTMVAWRQVGDRCHRAVGRSVGSVQQSPAGRPRASIELGLPSVVSLSDRWILTQSDTAETAHAYTQISRLIARNVANILLSTLASSDVLPLFDTSLEDWKICQHFQWNVRRVHKTLVVDNFILKVSSIRSQLSSTDRATHLCTMPTGGWPIKARPSACVITPNSVIQLQRV